VKDVSEERVLGFVREGLWVAEDFDAPLPAEVMRGFHGDSSG
jgi:hypothetical protein